MPVTAVRTKKAPALFCDLCGHEARENGHSLCVSCGETIVRLIDYPATAPSESPAQEPIPDGPHGGTLAGVPADAKSVVTDTRWIDIIRKRRAITSAYTPVTNEPF